MDRLEYELKGLCYRNRDGSYSTQAERMKVLRLSARELKQLGYRNMRSSSLKEKHVRALVDNWQGKGLQTATIKNKVAHLRWWAEKTDTRAAIPKDNMTLGITNRQYVTNENKAEQLTQEQLGKIPDQRTKDALRLQQGFGLRREEAIKFKVQWADKGDHIALKGSWTKGGRERTVPITTDSQRELLNELKTRYGGRSLIDDKDRYIDQLRRFERQTINADISHTHGLRHAYAQKRYAELTGWSAPALGGKTQVQMTPEERDTDNNARIQITSELGHGRTEITKIYLGR